ncbi:MAG: hypothetical protein B7X02_00340 [Rhodospirillales bacterium 12-54-5]|nr:MAG: hypothetical protein B7X02_00340 [Rhodospirillales bacterium 12-54-5]
MEKYLERGLFASRWLLAPAYVGLAGSLAILMLKFMQELLHFFVSFWEMSANDAILACLSLIDVTLAANLLIIVTFSGYENFISKMDVEGHEDVPGWQGKVDFSGLKLKLIASMVAISGIHLLKVFMDVGKSSEMELRWMIIIHLVFVFSGLVLAVMDYVSAKSKK